MEKPKVKVKNVTKMYRLYKNNAEKFLQLIFNKNETSKEFYAINNVSFEVEEGETVGIIGINGSGKSTLSNLLAGIIPPTEGEIHIDGDASLIAISAGLNNQLSGMDNIELKCLMHGLNSEQILKLKSSIIEFADIGDFINMPVKNYSSGMKARLGFAIAVHINPDVLIIDEALSVGDDTFYKKCLKKINEFKKQGKTIFFISHSAAQISAISDRVIWMNYGEIKEFGQTEEVITEYRKYVKWFNKLSKEEKKDYKQKMTKERLMPKRLNNQISPRKIKKKKSFSILIQSCILIILTLFCALLMFKDSLDGIFSLKEHINKVENENKSSVSTVEEFQEIEKIGYLDNENNTLYLDENLTEQSNISLEFASEVYIKVLNKSKKVYLIEYKNSQYYVPQSNIQLININESESDISWSDLNALLPESFYSSYEYFLVFLDSSSEQIKNSLNGVEEKTLSENTVLLNVEEADFAYFINPEDYASELIIDIESTRDSKNSLLYENAAIRSNDGLLLYWKIGDYKIILNDRKNTVTISKLNSLD